MSEVTPEVQDGSWPSRVEEEAEKVLDEAEALGWTLAHEAEGLVRYVKRFPYQDALAEAFGATKKIALENVKTQEAAQAPAAPAEVPAEEPAQSTEVVVADSTEAPAVDVPAA